MGELLELGWEVSPLSIVRKKKKKICKDQEKELVVSFTVLLKSNHRSFDCLGPT